MFRKIRFAAGSSEDAGPLELDLHRIILLVGPNNSGKSLALRDIEALATGRKEKGTVVSNVEVDLPERMEDALTLVRPFIQKETRDDRGRITYTLQHRKPGSDGESGSFRSDVLERTLQDPGNRDLRRWLLDPFVIRLDGRTRFGLVDEQEMPSLLSPPTNHLWHLFQSPKARERVRALTEENFDLHFVLDPLRLGRVGIRMSPEPPPKKYREAIIAATARPFMEAAPRIQDWGDGVQAYVGITASLEAGAYRLILLDEPEAFLAPPLVRRLGREVAELALREDGHLVVATHSSDFLFGCLSASTSISLCRLTFQNQKASVRALDGRQVRDFLVDPLLRSAGLIDGLFHRGAAICEADRDRAFYSEINRRLNRLERGASDTIFLNAQNWQTIERMVAALRSLGVPAVGIMDLDVLGGSDVTWARICETFGFPKNQWTRIHRQRKEIAAEFQKLPTQPGRLAPIKAGGLGHLGVPERDEARKFLDYLARYGLFILPVGEVEAWLSHLGVRGKRQWLERMFAQIGAVEDDPNFVSPAADDVWAFLDSVGTWIEDPKRAGISI